MTTKILLIRHASVDGVGQWLAGRTPHVHLNQQGRQEGGNLARQLEDTKLDAIYSSPLERARETAQIVAERQRIPVRVRDEFNEVHFGCWTGKKIFDLEGLPEWRHFNESRSTARIPGGESMDEVLKRMVAGVGEVWAHHAGQCVAIFSHCDPIRVLVAHYLGMDVNYIDRIAINPASITVLVLAAHGPLIESLNRAPEMRAMAAAKECLAASGGS